MSTRTLDLSLAENVCRELLEDDRAVREPFAAALERELNDLAAALAVCFARLPPIHAAASRLKIQRVDLMCAFALGVLDDLVVAAKLLLAGKVPASGNVMRQAIEGVAMAILCSTDELLVIEQRPNKAPVSAHYAKKVWLNDDRVQGQHAVRQLTWNASKFELNADGVATLKRAQKFFHTFSHCGPFTVASRAAFEQPGHFHIGGHFETAKLDSYRAHIEQFIGLSSVLPGVLDYLLHTIPPAGPAAADNPAAAANPLAAA